MRDKRAAVGQRGYSSGYATGDRKAQSIDDRAHHPPPPTNALPADRTGHKARLSIDEDWAPRPLPPTRKPPSGTTDWKALSIDDRVPHPPSPPNLQTGGVTRSDDMAEMLPTQAPSTSESIRMVRSSRNAPAMVYPGAERVGGTGSQPGDDRTLLWVDTRSEPTTFVQQEAEVVPNTEVFVASGISPNHHDHHQQLTRQREILQRKIKCERLLLWMVGSLLVILVVVGGTVGGILGTRNNSSNSGQAVATSSPTVSLLPTDGPFVSPTPGPTLLQVPTPSPTTEPPFSFDPTFSSDPSSTPSFSFVPSAVPSTTTMRWVQLGLDVEGQSAGDEFGYSVALSSDGTIFAAGTRLSDDNGVDSGQVRVLKWNGTSWSQLGEGIFGDAPDDQFGTTVALSSNGAVVAAGSRTHDGFTGQVRVFEWNGTVWNQRGASLFGSASDEFGFSVALSSDGKIVAGGAWRSDVNGVDSGHVMVFVWDGTMWNQRGANLDGGAALDYFGVAVALSSDGNTLAVGANQFFNRQGYVRVFAWSGISWERLGEDIVGDGVGDLAGNSVELSASGTVLAVGAIWHDSNDHVDAGQVRVLEWDGFSWVRRGESILGQAADDYFGSSLALSANGDVLAAGANGHDSSNGTTSGQARIYEWTGLDWVPRGQSLDSRAADDLFGSALSISLDGNTIAIGGRHHNGANGPDTGHVRAFQWFQ